MTEHRRRSGNFSPPGSAPAPLRAPHQVYSPRNFWMGVRFDPAGVRRALPPRLAPVAECTGGVGIGYVLAGDAGALDVQVSVYVDVEGFDAPDGRPGRFSVWGCYGPATGIGGDGEGRAAFAVANGILTAEVAAGSARIAASARIFPNQVSETVRFSNSMVALSPDNRLVCAAVPTFIARRVAASPVGAMITAGKDHPLSGLVPVAVIWAALNYDIYYAAGLPVPSAHDGRKALQTLFDHLDEGGRGVLLLENGRLSLINGTAREMLAGEPSDREPPIPAAVGRDAFRSLVDTLRRAGLDAATGAFAVPRSAGRRPLLAVAIEVPPESAPGSSDATLVFLTDPDRRPEGRDQASAMLQLLGLTPFEARVAAHAATGIARRDVARRLNLSEDTVRVTMSLVYGKLGIARQSELAGMVARFAPLA